MPGDDDAQEPGPSGAIVLAGVKKELAAARGAVTKAITRARAAMVGDVTVDKTSDVRACQDKLKEYKDRLSVAMSSLGKVNGVTLELVEAELTKQLDYDERIEEVDLDIIAYLRKNDPESFREDSSRPRAHSSSIQNETAAAVVSESRLQSTMNDRPGPLKLTPWKEILHRVPKFDGDPTKFRRWQGAFDAHIDSAEMTPQEKFELLLKTLTGRVLKALQTREVTADNYEGARDKIYEKFCDRELARQGHLRNVYSICARRDIDRGTRFIEFVEDLIVNVESLAINGETYEGMSLSLHSTILQALSYNRRSKFMDYFTDRQRNGDGDCKLQCMMDFLEDEVKKVEALTRAEQEYMAAAAENRYRGRSDRFEKKADQGKKFEGRRFFNPAGPTGSKSSQHAFAVAASEPVDHSCIFCAGEHSSAKCTKTMSPEERKRCATTKNACYRCLDRNHRAEKCRVRGCANCRGSHHVMLCSRGNRRVAALAPVVARDQSASVNSVHLVNVAHRNLPTGYVEILTEEREMMGRIVLDTGSQKTLISNRAADLNGSMVFIDPHICCI